MPQEDNKRIAKNTLYLYIRMFLTMAVSLYTSRIVLSALGVTDFGIWNVVGGVISMFSFLNASMSGATSRFITYEIGKKKKGNVQGMFSAALTVHLLIASIVFLLGETIGLWFLQNKLVIPADRIFAANFLYQVTIISTMVSITQVPYNAMIMANEHMNVYAYIEFLNVILKLLNVYLLTILPYDKLIVYSILTFILSVGIAMIYRGYCVKRLQGCRFIVSTNKKLISPMLKFSGWDLYGNASVMARTQGVNMLLNMFFTVAMNAASGVATQVQTAVASFAGNVLQAFRPQIVKSYAQEEYGRMVILIKKASQYTTMLLLIFTIPLLIDIDFVLSLWLKETPRYASVLCRYTLTFTIFANLSSCVISGIHATGQIMRPSFINGSLYLLVIPFSYCAFKYGSPPYMAYLFNVLAVIIGMFSNVHTLNLYVKSFKQKDYIYNVLLRCTFIAMLSGMACFIIYMNMSESIIRLICLCLMNVMVICPMTYYVLMEIEEREFIRNYIKKRLCRKG